MATRPDPYIKAFDEVSADADPYSKAIWMILGAIAACVDVRASDRIGEAEHGNMMVLQTGIHFLDPHTHPKDWIDHENT